MLSATRPVLALAALVIGLLGVSANANALASAPSAVLSEAPIAQDFNTGSYFDWGRGRDGWGHCYEWTFDGRVLNGGQPVADYQCEMVAPSRYSWGRGMDGYTYCYRVTPNGLVLNQGRPVASYYCR